MSIPLYLEYLLSFPLTQFKELNFFFFFFFLLTRVLPLHHESQQAQFRVQNCEFIQSPSERVLKQLAIFFEGEIGESELSEAFLLQKEGLNCKFAFLLAYSEQSILVPKL